MTTAPRSCPPANLLRLSKQRLIDGEDWQPIPYADMDDFNRMFTDNLAALNDMFAAVGLGLAEAIPPARRTCRAMTRKGTPCRALALANGRCRNHGGMSTGPTSAAGWERTRAGHRAWVESRRAGREAQILLP